MEGKLDNLIASVAAMDQRLKKMEEMVDELSTSMKTRIDTCEKNIKILNSNLKKASSELEAATKKNIDLEEKQKALEKQLEDALKSATERVKAAEKVSDDIIEATQRLRNLRVDQLPEVTGENLRQTMSKLFAAVGSKLDDRTRYYRLKTGLSNGTIIINFPTEAEKEIFFSHYIKVARNLLVSQFVENPKHKDARVYVSHDLCQTQYRIWKELSKVREGIIKGQRIHRGFVYIKTSIDKPLQRILSLEMLHNIID